MVHVVLGPTRSRLEGPIDEAHLNHLRKELSFLQQGAWFSQSYRNKQWDGRTYFLTRIKREFPTGLAARVIQLLQALKLDYQIQDARAQFDSGAVQYMPTRNEFVLRDYQKEAVDTALRHGSGVLRMATGAGKSAVAISIVAEYERPAIILVHRRDLMYQMLDMLRGDDRDGRRVPGMCLYPELVGQVGGGVYAPNLITVATVQTLCAALGVTGDDETDESDATGARRFSDRIERCLSEAQVIVVDECHHVPANTIYEILKRAISAPFRFGLSATDWRDDGCDMFIEAALGPRIVNISLSELIGRGWLVPPKIQVFDIEAPRQKYEGPERWSSVETHFIVKNEALNQQSANITRKWHAAGRTVLTLVNRIAHGKRMAELLNGNNVRTAFLSGDDSDEFRKATLDDVRSKKIRSLVATSIADEGLNLPSLDAVNLVGGGKSSTKLYQRIGRTLRPAPGKEYAVVADFMVGGHEWLEEHARIRENMYHREPAFEIVPSSVDLV